MEPEIVKYLRSFDDPEEAVNVIQSKYHLRVNRHIDYPNLCEFKYSQIDSPMKKQLVQEARGIILDQSDNWKVIAHPFDKFFNYSEHRAAKIDWDTATTLEKIDGSLMFIYWYNREWNVASSGLPDASGVMSESEVTFREYFWNIWKNLEYEMPGDENITYIFELSSPDNVIVVPQEKAMITFIGARDNMSGLELSIDNKIFPEGWKRPHRFLIHSEKDALNQCIKMNPMDQEGFVVVDKNFNRIKMKSPQYAAIAHLGFTREEIIERNLNLDKFDENTQMKWMLKIVLTNESDEFLLYYPQYTNLYNYIHSRYINLRMNMEFLYDEIKNITNQFDYAQKVNKHKLSGIFFQLKSDRIKTIDEGLRNTDTKKLLKIILSK